MKKIEAVIRPERLASVAAALEEKGFNGFTVADVRGHGQSPERVGEYRGRTYELHVTHKLEISVIVEDSELNDCVGAIVKGARTGSLGDGLISVSEITTVYQIRTGMPVASGGSIT